jgi:serine/threonine protein phosphatase PrpC
MNGERVTCVQCGAVVVPADLFCEGCGTVVRGVRRVAIPGQVQSQEVPCADCGGATYVDDYCAACGNRRAEPARAQADLDGIVLITDRGLEHPRNEDAAAAGIVACGSGEAIAVAVCDGVSSSTAADTAARGASTAGVNAMLNALAAESKPESAVLAGLAAAAKAAVDAGAETPNLSIAPSCTYSSLAVLPAAEGKTEIAVGNVGDSRIYWLPEPPAHARCLTVDDSVAQELIAAGAAAASEAVQAGAHTITRWLGADAGPMPWSDSSVRPIIIAGPGVLLVCTDGLWNYLPEADDIARICGGYGATDAATALLEFAWSAGGQDNITVVVIPIGGTS